ncbi:MAG: dCMP deaminase family protein [Candidatus Peribacteria bacterium]|jgi:dCMP deaminase|nr:dCMP deaminase family protein [Candidatus Peribacteria bacterium]
MKREKYLSWEESFMLIAIISSLRSKDPSKRVGACIVNSENVIVGTGYNGLPRGFNDDEFPWEKSDDFKKSRNSYVVHSEENAIANARGELKECKMYVTLFPCNECAKLIVQKRIEKVIYLSASNMHNAYVPVALEILQKGGVEVEKSSINAEELLGEFPKMMEELLRKDLSLI